MMRYTRTQHRRALPQVNSHGRVSDPHRWLDYYGYFYGLINLPSEQWHWSTDGA